MLDTYLSVVVPVEPLESEKLDWSRLAVMPADEDTERLTVSEKRPRAARSILEVPWTLGFIDVSVGVAARLKSLRFSK